MSKRNNCEKKDSIMYFTFWPIVAFSFFIATDQITDNVMRTDVNAIILALIIICKKFIHMFSIACLIVSLTEAYISFEYVENPLCNRPTYLEFNAFMSAAFLIVLSFIESISYIVSITTPLSDVGMMLCNLIPWCIVVIVIIYQTISLFLKFKVITFQFTT